MAIAYVRTFTGQADFVTAASATVPAAGCAAGNLLVVSSIGYTEGLAAPTLADSKLNSYSNASLPVTTFTSQVCSCFIGYSILGSALVSGDTITATYVGANGVSLIVDEYSGIASSTPLDKTTSRIEAFNSTHTSGATAATTQADELLVGHHIFPTGTTWSATGGYAENTEFDAFTFQVAVTQFLVVAATGTYASTGTTVLSRSSLNQIATFKGAAAAPPAGPIATLMLRKRRSRQTSW